MLHCRCIYTAFFRTTYFEILKKIIEFWKFRTPKKACELVCDVAVALNFSGPRTLRLYGHCTKGTPSHVTVFGQNMGPQPIDFALAYYKQGSVSTNAVHQYELTAKGGKLLSKRVCLNGQEIGDPSPELPALLPKPVDGFHMKPFSFSFWTLPAPKGSVCWKMSHEFLSIFTFRELWKLNEYYDK